MMVRRPLRSASLLGTRVHFAQPSNLYFLSTEIFIRESYSGCMTPPATILDCGSNIGLSILYFKSVWLQARSTGVEAAPDTFPVLQQNTQGLADVVVLNRAVSDSRGTIPFYSAVAHSGTASTNPLRGGAARPWWKRFP